MEAVAEGAERIRMLEGLFARLSREPDFDAPELQAYDAADELLLRQELSDPLVVIGDSHGALTLGAASLGARGIRCHQDPLLSERALRQNAERLGLADVYISHPLDETLLSGARTVLVRLPRGFEALEEIAWTIARYAHPEVRVLAAGRVKHMTKAQNEVLGRYFADVRAGLGWRKARVLTAERPKPAGSAPFPKWGSDAELPFELAAFGATFGGPKLDHGSRLLLSTLAKESGAPRRVVDLGADDLIDDSRVPHRVVDLGCGNGVLAVSAALRWPDAEIIASDQSEAAVRATRRTAERAGVVDRLAIHRADGTEAVPSGWADLILLNPPFHSGAAVHAGVAHRLIRHCPRALAPGGELRLVFNSHLAYRPLVSRLLRDVEQLARDRSFTVLSARRR